MVQTERKTRYHKPVRKVDNYMLLNRDEHKRSRSQRFRHTNCAGCAQLQLIPPSVFTLPEMECGHKIPKHCQRGTTQSLWATRSNSTHLHQLQVKNFMFKGIYTPVWSSAITSCITLHQAIPGTIMLHPLPEYSFTDFGITGLRIVEF